MTMKKRWISLMAENEVGVLARISGLFSGKSYNLNSLTVGTTEDKTISRMTISLTSDEQTFEQVKKQLNRSIEVIKIMDFTDIPIHMKELMFVKIQECTPQDMIEISRICEIFKVKIIDYNASAVLLESVQTETRNDDLIHLLEHLLETEVRDRFLQRPLANSLQIFFIYVFTVESPLPHPGFPTTDNPSC